ncbi:Alpha/Beta hydrolase protein [Amanita rubescens]|nr:Alpha/Beta hydrolase protein [Amanita rubescens]
MPHTSRLNIKDIVDPTYPLLGAKRTSINAIKRATYAYGSTDAHQLDVYYPPSSGSAQAVGDSRPPIVVFFHGGSLIHGSRSSPPQYLVHNNLGAYFASRGVLAVITDYRLVPNAVFPQGAEDVRDALLWVIEHVSEGDPTQIYVLGHSAGGIHIANMLLLPHLFQLQLRQALRGVVLIGVPYEIPGGKMSEFRSAATQYYGSVRNIALNQPLGLLRRAGTGGHITVLPPIRNIIGENEPRRIKGSARAFSKLFREKGGVLEDFTLQGHDHISSILALSTDVGEEWAQEIVNWISRCGAAPCGQVRIPFFKNIDK